MVKVCWLKKHSSQPVFDHILSWAASPSSSSPAALVIRPPSPWTLSSSPSILCPNLTLDPGQDKNDDRRGTAAASNREHMRAKLKLGEEIKDSDLVHVKLKQAAPAASLIQLCSLSIYSTPTETPIYWSTRVNCKLERRQQSNKLQHQLRIRIFHEFSTCVVVITLFGLF